MEELGKSEANYSALTPLTFLKRAAGSYSDRVSVIYGDVRFTWRETYLRCCRLASSLRSLGIAKNDVVSVLAPNIPALYEMHFAVPMAGAILNTINTRLDANNIKTILAHSEAKILFVDYEYVPLVCKAFRLLTPHLSSSSSPPKVVIINDIASQNATHNNHVDLKLYQQLVLSTSNNTNSISESTFPLLDVDRQSSPTHPHLRLEYEQLVANGDPYFEPLRVDDEWDSITLNYTSGTTSAPKGVVYSHRGAFLSTLSLILGWEMGTAPVYLWTLPMFHCNGWTFTWGIAARGGTNVCIRNTTAQEIYRAIALHGVTHMCCAPIVFNIILNAKPDERIEIRSSVQILTGGAPPPANLLQEVEKLGFHVVHAYGLTEATGPAMVCEWQKKWNRLPLEERANLKARQGLSVLTVADSDVKDVNTMQSVPRDGKTMGEIVLKGSGIMKGYFKNSKATNEAFDSGWFHTGDMGVIHPDGYVEIKDRLKDVIISGGENISSVEVESVITKHPRVSEVGVVGMAHPIWGESPCAFVVLKKDDELGGGNKVSEQDILGFSRSNLPHYMVPKKAVFVDELPKTSTGKILKVMLREYAKKFCAPANESSHVVATSRL